MTSHIEQFLKVLETELPPICADKDLIEVLPDIFRNVSNLTRMRARGQTPPYFHVQPHIHYLRNDVIDWLKNSYSITKSVKLEEYLI